MPRSYLHKGKVIYKRWTQKEGVFYVIEGRDKHYRTLAAAKNAVGGRSKSKRKKRRRSLF